MTYKLRDFHFNEDFDSARRFLGDIYELTGKHYTWVPSRLENIKHGGCGSEYSPEDDEWVKIWEHVDGEGSAIVAVTILESNGYFWINIHPDHNALVKEIIPAIEAQRKHMSKGEEEELKIGTPVPVSFKSRIAHLKELEYEDGGVCEHNRIRPLNLPPPEFQPPEGYTIRHVALPEDFEEYRKVLGSVFPHCANITKNLVRIYTEAEFYNDDLDIVVEAPDGSFAAFTTVRIDPISRMAELEPVGTHPDHRGLGLGKAICAEGIRRVQKYDPSCMVILGAASTESATRLYDSLGFSKVDDHIWKKLV